MFSFKLIIYCVRLLSIGTLHVFFAILYNYNMLSQGLDQLDILMLIKKFCIELFH
jgi:hypothetical protein